MDNNNQIDDVEIIDDSDTEIDREELQFVDSDRFDNLRNTLQYRQWDVTPDAKIDYPDINRDVVNANLDQIELHYIRMCESLIGKIDFLIRKGNDLHNLKRFLNREVSFILTSSLSKNGFLREQTNTVTNRLIRGMERRNTKPRRAIGSFGGNNE